MASRCGFSLWINYAKTALAELFSEELGFVIEIMPEYRKRIKEICKEYRVPFLFIAITSSDNSCTITADHINSRNEGKVLFKTSIENLRLMWESTSYQIEKLQSNSECAIKGIP